MDASLAGSGVFVLFKCMSACKSPVKCFTIISIMYDEWDTAFSLNKRQIQRIAPAFLSKMFEV